MAYIPNHGINYLKYLFNIYIIYHKPILVKTPKSNWQKKHYQFYSAFFGILTILLRKRRKKMSVSRFFSRVTIFCSLTAPDMALCLVFLQNLSNLDIKPGVHSFQTVRYLLMYGRF